MSSTAGPDPEHLLYRAQAGNGPALGQLLELYDSYLTLLARLQIGRRLQGKVDAADLIKDAVARDQALDAYQDFMARKREPRIRALEDQRKRLEQEIAAEEESWREWRRRKRAREHEMAHAVGYLIDGPVITTDEE